MAKIQSIEPNIADLANGWLKSYKLDYKTVALAATDLMQSSYYKTKT